jgi:hypothetical protein
MEVNVAKIKHLSRILKRGAETFSSNVRVMLAINESIIVFVAH